MLELLLLPWLTGIGVALLAGPYGCLLVWRRMAFFGDTLAHAALPGVALALWLELDITATVVLSSLVTVLLLLLLARHSRMPTDTVLAVIAHSALALGLLGVALAGGRGPALESFLLGDLLAVGLADLAWIGIALALLGTLLLVFWSDWLAITVSAELARVEGRAVAGLQLLQMISTAVLIALAIRAIGVLLVSALLVLPAVGVRRLVRSPERMALLATLLACLAVTLGLGISWLWDTPAGPSIVVAATALFTLAQLAPTRTPWPARS